MVIWRNSASVVLALALASGCAYRPIDLGADLRGDVVNGRYVHPEGRFSYRLPSYFGRFARVQEHLDENEGGLDLIDGNDVTLRRQFPEGPAETVALQNVDHDAYFAAQRAGVVATMERAGARLVIDWTKHTTIDGHEADLCVILVPGSSDFPESAYLRTYRQDRHHCYVHWTQERTAYSAVTLFAPMRKNSWTVDAAARVSGLREHLKSIEAQLVDLAGRLITEDPLLESRRAVK